MQEMRLERDSMGELEVPVEALYGAQTQRAVLNFPISHQPMPQNFVRAYWVKRAAAKANAELECIQSPIADAIVKAYDGLLELPDLMQHFPVDVFKPGRAPVRT